MYNSGRDTWAPELLPRRPDLNMGQVERYPHDLYRARPEFVCSVSRDFAERRRRLGADQTAAAAADHAADQAPYQGADARNDGADEGSADRPHTGPDGRRRPGLAQGRLQQSTDQ